MMDTPGSDRLSALRDQVLEVIATRAPSVRSVLVDLLSRPGYVLHPEGACRAGALALEVNAAVTAEPCGSGALLGAAAVELQMEAAYIFDEVADSAPYDERSEHLALAIALLTAGFAAAVDAASASPDSADSLRRFCSAYCD